MMVDSFFACAKPREGAAAFSSNFSLGYIITPAILVSQSTDTGV
jgi:hypothetical protein